MIVDLFSGGGGGWCLAARELGIPSIGIEWDGPSCGTRAVVGLATIRADVSTYPAEVFAGKVAGITGGPPCQSFSSAGKRKGLADPRGQMIYEPMRYMRAIRPRWVALEQVPEVLGYWRWISRELVELGYSTWTGILECADYGVPQNRRRAILLASVDRKAEPPAPTHSRTGHADMLGYGLPRWVSMAEGLGWAPAPWCGDRPSTTICGSNPGIVNPSGGGAKVSMSQRGYIPVLHTGSKSEDAAGPHDYMRTIDRPAPVVRTGSVGRWQLRSPGRSTVTPPRRADAATEPAPTIALGNNVAAWCWERPATAVQCDPRIAPPGHHEHNRDETAIPIEPWELGVLQGFPADHPWQPPYVSAQIGNAIPPPLALACLRSITGREPTPGRSTTEAEADHGPGPTGGA